MHETPSSLPGSGRWPGEGIGHPLQCSWAFLGAQLLKILPVMWETRGQSLGWEDPLGKGAYIISRAVFACWLSVWHTQPQKEFSVKQKGREHFVKRQRLSQCQMLSELPIKRAHAKHPGGYSRGLASGMDVLKRVSSLDRLRRTNWRQVI